MSERWEDLGGQRPEHVEPVEPVAAPVQHRGKPHHRPFCSTACRERYGWVEDANGDPIRKCECREASE
jgi:hypothetical protein